MTPFQLRRLSSHRKQGIDAIEGRKQKIACESPATYCSLGKEVLREKKTDFIFFGRFFKLYRMCRKKISSKNILVFTCFPYMKSLFMVNPRVSGFFCPSQPWWFFVLLNHFDRHFSKSTKKASPVKKSSKWTCWSTTKHALPFCWGITITKHCGGPKFTHSLRRSHDPISSSRRKG